MQSQARTIRVLVFLVASMTIGAFALMALDTQSISEGPFSLSSYTRLNSLSSVAVRPIAGSGQMWNRIDVYYSNTTEGSIADLARLQGLTNPKDANFHLVVSNGKDAHDGQVLASDKWKKQFPCLADGTGLGAGRTIRICVIGTPLGAGPTDSQIKRATALVEMLSRKCSIEPQKIRFPKNWQF
jgi:hypothetical protein